MRRNEMAPEERNAIMEKERRKARTPFTGPKKKTTTDEYLPGELEAKKEMAIILKVAGYSHNQIGAAIGSTRGTVKAWFQERDMRERFAMVAKTMSESAKKLLHSYMVEAVEALVDVMRNSTDEQNRIKVALEILDRGGLPKVSRSEQKVETPPVEAAANDLAEMTPEQQAKLAEKMDEFLSDVTKEGTK